MCIVVDADAFSSLANTRSSKHNEFRPLLKWITRGKGKVVYGGSKYEEELRRHQGFSDLIAELEILGKTVERNHDNVDVIHDFLENNITSRDVNDHHIIAIIYESGCKLICSEDRGLHNLINICFETQIKSIIKSAISSVVPLPGEINKPRVYQNSSHSGLCCDQYIGICCK